MHMMQTRRQFLTTLSLAGAAGLLDALSARAAEAPPEVTKLRLLKLYPGICIAPQYVADELLRAEGFTQIEYVLSQSGAPAAAAVAGGTVDFSLNYAAPNIIAVDAGEPLVTLAGVHVGCFELFGHEGIRSIADLKGKQVGVLALGSSQHVYLATMLSYRSRLHPQLSLCLGRVEQVALQSMAGMGSQRHASVLRSPAGRGRPDQV